MTTNNAINTPKIILGGAFTTSGAFTTTFTVTGNTSVTLPTSGTLVNTGVTALSSLATVGTVTSGTWSSALQDYTEITTAASTGSSYTMNLNNGNVFSLTLTANCTLAFSNVPVSNTVSLTLELIQDGTGSRTVTWPGSIVWNSGITPTLRTAPGAVDIFVMITFDNGTTWHASYVNGSNTGFLLASNNLSDVASISTSVSHLGLTIGTNTEAWSASLDALAALSSTGLIAQTGANTFADRTITGTSGTITVSNGTGASGNPTITIDSSYVGQTSITTLGTVGTGTWNGSVIGGTYGGTGVNNGASTITLGGNLTTSGAFTTTFTITGNTNVTLPTSGTLITNSVTSLSSLATVGTITSGTWNASVITGTYGGTGVNNGASTITLGGNLTTSGAFTTTFTVTGNTNVTLPTSGTLITNAVTSLSSLATVGTITSGTWNGSVVTGTYGGTGVNNGASTITIGGNVSFSGAFATTFTVTAGTSVTLPTSGTLVNTGVTSLSSLATVGTVTSGTWSAVLQDYTETNTAASSSTAYTMNMNNGNVFSITLTGNCTFSMSNVPASGCVSLTLILIQGSGPYTVSWPTSFIWAGGTAPTLSTTNGHVDVFTAISTNGGTTFRAFTCGQNFAS